MGKSKCLHYNSGSRFTRNPNMLNTDEINRISVLSSRGLGAKSIVNATGFSRNTVRKYVRFIKAKEPIPTLVQRSCRLDPYREQIFS